MTTAMQECMRWYGPTDQVPLQYIRQAGASGVYTSLHEIAYGEKWQRERIAQRKRLIEQHGLKWVAVESVPVHEDIKTRSGDYRRYIENYKETLHSLGEEGIDLVIYNFMPVLDWVRTDLAYRLDDGSECLYFNPVQFAAFEIHILQRQGAESCYGKEQLKQAKEFYDSLTNSEKKTFEKTIIDVFPGCKLGLSIDDIREMIAVYDRIDAEQLKENYFQFLREVIPVAEAAGVRMAVHPDDPPFPILGLPRIVSTADDLRQILEAVDSPANGLCFCTGSLSPRADNNLPQMIRNFGSRIHCAHLRSTHRNSDGSFYEADHLGGSVDMYEVVRELLLEMQKRKTVGRPDWRLAFRPDHGHTMLDDLEKQTPDNPGYSAIGRLRGLAEIRGLQLGIGRGLQT